MKLNTNNYKEVLSAFKLPEFWEKCLRSSESKTSEEALRFLEKMGTNVSGNAVSHKVFSSNKSVRKHAKSVFMKFDSHDAFKFLDNGFDSDFNSLDELRIHTSLYNKSLEKPLPLLMRWVNGVKDDNYKAFLIKEIGFFKQLESANALITLFKEESSQRVKAQIATTLGKLKSKEAVDVFKEDFDYSSQQVQDAIIDALGVIGCNKSLDFLEQIYYNLSRKEALIKVFYNIYLIDHQKVVYNRIKNNVTTEFEKALISYVELNNSNQ
ncbi:HEAT repeat domain-containing protein [Myroides injenensis]|uniref:HEAT repeat domain-containing protein n=1 Tax=Myroides injenensis TaxID=1183151 RepID=UPI000289F980|nr:HEAT repeat domain-containing protein [Myroides injenensis]